MTHPLIHICQSATADEQREVLDPETFKLRRYEISVSCFSQPVSSDVLATSRGKAMADAWRCDAFNGYTFGEFLKVARCRLSHYQPKPIPITVSGDLVWGLGHNRQYVQFVRPDGDFVLHSHPLDVMPESARPSAYRLAAILTAKEANDG